MVMAGKTLSWRFQPLDELKKKKAGGIEAGQRVNNSQIFSTVGQMYEV